MNTLTFSTNFPVDFPVLPVSLSIACILLSINDLDKIEPLEFIELDPIENTSIFDRSVSIQASNGAALRRNPSTLFTGARRRRTIAGDVHVSNIILAVQIHVGQ